MNIAQARAAYRRTVGARTIPNSDVPYVVRVFAFRAVNDRDRGVAFRYPTNTATYKTLHGARRGALRAIERESWEGSVVVNALGEKVARFERDTDYSVTKEVK